VGLPDGEKNFEDMYIRFDKMYERDRHTDEQTHRHRMTAKAAHVAAKTDGMQCLHCVVTGRVSVNGLRRDEIDARVLCPARTLDKAYRKCRVAFNDSSVHRSVTN